MFLKRFCEVLYEFEKHLVIEVMAQNMLNILNFFVALGRPCNILPCFVRNVDRIVRPYMAL